MNRETKKAAQDAYHEARAFGHTKEESKQIRDNWKPSKPVPNFSEDDDYDCDYDYYENEVELDDPDFDDYDY